MIMSLPSLRITVFFNSLCFNMVSFKGQKKPDEHPSPFYMGVLPPSLPPPPPDPVDIKVSVTCLQSSDSNTLSIELKKGVLECSLLRGRMSPTKANALGSEE